MFRDVAQKVLGRTTIKRGGEEIDLAKPWRRVTMRELILERFGLDFMESTRDQLAEVLDEPVDRGGDAGRRSSPTSTPRKSSRTINQPTHVFDFPLEPFPITKRHAVHPELGEHFDAVIGGIELVSGDTELNDPVDQWQRFVDQRKRRMIDDEDVPHPNDEEYARAIEYGYSPTAGGGMGVDRLIMILTERDTLREVIPFPIVRDLQMSAPGRTASWTSTRAWSRRAARRPSRSPSGVGGAGRGQHDCLGRALASRGCSASTARTRSRCRCRTCSSTTSHDARRARRAGSPTGSATRCCRPAARPSSWPRRSARGELELTLARPRRRARDPRARQRGVRGAPG